MKKILLALFMFAACPIANFAQAVLGIEFGSSYQQVKSALEKRYGEYNVLEEEGNLHIYGLQMGSFYFNHAEFQFQRDAGNSYFNYARFERSYGVKDVETAKRERDYLYEILSDKYKDETSSYINDNGFKCYVFGKNPKEESFLGVIDLDRAKNKKGELFLWITLEYGPIYYLPKSSDF